jgi:hypothetical protein
MEIRIRVGRRWKNEGDEEQLAKRIARIVSYSDEACEQKKDGYKWALDYRGNDWWMSGIEDGYIKVAYRYGQKEVMEGLRVFLQWAVGQDED